MVESQTHRNMSRRLLVVSLWLLHQTSGLGTSDTPTEGCSPPCGYQSVCQDLTCTCPAGFTLHGNGKDCKNVSCSGVDCLQCKTAIVCLRCETFLVVPTGVCLAKCEGSAEVKDGTLVCSESKKKDEGVSMLVAVLAGVAAGTVLCVVVVVFSCVYIHKTRRNINLQTKNYASRQMDSGHVKQFAEHDNTAYEVDGQAAYKSSKIDPMKYASELEKLRPHTDMLMALLSQVRSRTRAMEDSDERVPTYKGVIHQLCRVLVLIHKRDPAASIPSDALGLIQWAQQMLEDHKEQQSSTGDSTDFPIAQISSVDLDFDNPNHPVYATPERGHHLDPSALTTPGAATPYCTVPVPLSEEDQQQPYPNYGTGKRPGFATISRARAKPSVDLIKALEAELSSPNPVPMSPKDPLPILQNQSNILRREYLQQFLIQSGEKHNNNPSVHQSVPIAEKSSKLQQAESLNNKGSLNSESRQNKINLLEHANPFLYMIQRPVKSRPPLNLDDRNFGTLPSAKKNIITNPKTLKKSYSMTGKNSKLANSHLGYFANGHYYDPNPMPAPDTEVYAPGSNYSNYSNAMSTFLGDLPRSRSVSSSEQSEDGFDDSENSGGDLDVFPFDPQDCTDPVEV